MAGWLGCVGGGWFWYCFTVLDTKMLCCWLCSIVGGACLLIIEPFSKLGFNLCFCGGRGKESFRSIKMCPMGVIHNATLSDAVYSWFSLLCTWPKLPRPAPGLQLVGVTQTLSALVLLSGSLLSNLF